MMKKMRGVVLVALIVFGAMLQAEYCDALLGKHELVTCGDCHTDPDGFAGALFDQTPKCLGGACHTNTALVEADASQLFNYSSSGGPVGTSHAWGVPLWKQEAGAQWPSTTQKSSWAPSGILGCSSCHWPHYPLANTTSLLKRDNSADQLCLDCHRLRNTATASPPAAGKQASHPVGVTIPADSAHNSPPLDPYGVSGSELRLVGAGSDTVSCSTCHGVHFADSNPYTAATMNGLSSVPGGQGMLLRRYNDAQLCKDCHYYQQHGTLVAPATWQDCRNCHSPHSVGSNMRLIKFDNLSTPFGNKTTVFNSLTTNHAFTASGKGICEVCHDIATTFLSWSSKHAPLGAYPSDGPAINCLSCHTHAEGDGTSVGSFAAGGAAACGTCHGFPPMANYSGSPNGYAGGYNLSGSFMNESTVGKHRIHASVYPYAGSGGYGVGACKACHGYPDETTHKNGIYQNVETSSFKLYTWAGWTPTYNTGTYVCANVYCHSDGAPNGTIGAPNTAADWDGAGLNCSGCHDATPATNRHTAHAAGNYNFGCENCHDTTVSDNTTISSTSVHVNRVKDVAFGGFTSAAGDYDSGTKVCSNNYCHGEFPNGDNTNDPDWDIAGAACGSCHALPPVAPVDTHVEHFTTYGYDCAYCHNGQMDLFDNVNLTNYTGHVDGTKSIDFANDGSRTNADGTYAGGKCNKTYCHSAGTSTLSANFFVNESTVWSSAVTTCKSCHGDSTLGGWTSAMPNYSTTAPKANSHEAHVVTNGYDCNICHDSIVGADNASITDTANHVDGNYDVNFAAPYDGGGAVYTPGTPGQCDNVSCHGGPGSNVSWGAVVTCSDCHTTTGADLDENGTFSNNTAARIAMSQWTSTGHGRDSGSTYFSGASGAGKGCLEAGSGAGCHDASVSHGDAGNPFRLYTSPTDTDIFCKSCHAASGADVHSAASTDGRHTPFNIKCLDCHDAHGDDNIFMMHSTIYEATAANSYTPSDTYGIQDETLPPRNVNFTNNAAASDYGTQNAANGKTEICNVCHMRTTKQNPLTTDKRYRRDMLTGSLDDHFATTKCISCHQHDNGFEGVSCEGCHGMPPTAAFNLISSAANEQSGSVTAGMHAKHVAVYTAGTNCELCHDGGMNVSPNEFNNRIDMDFSSTLGAYTTGTYNGQSVVAGGLYNYTGAGAGVANDSYQCSNVKCHGTELTSIGGQGFNTTPFWNVSSTGDCGTCHGAKQAPGTPFTNASAYPDSASHAKHAGYGAGQFDMMCKTCHNTSLSDASTPVDSVHVNAQANVALDNTDARIDAGATYGGDTAIGSGYGNCTNTYCHSLGNVTTTGFNAPNNAALAWGDSAVCSSCHGNGVYGGINASMPNYANGAPKFNSHSTHSVANGFDCAACHYDTTRDNLSIYSSVLHVNKAYDVEVSPAYDDGDFTYGAQCLNTDCHGNQPTAWGAGSLTCGECHNNITDPEDDFTFSNFSGTEAIINSTEWLTTGHGRSSAYPVSGNAAANLACDDCHDSSLLHAGGAEYFRLYSSNTDALCLGCHGTAAERGKSWSSFANTTGYQGHTWANLNAAGYTNLTTWQFQPKCIDCHDPHGDGNIFMMHAKVSDEGSDAAGIPANFPNNSTVNFTAVAGADSYDDGGAGTQSLCVVCHDRTSHNGDHGGSNYETTDCRSCHDHKLGFTPTGCDGCHAAVPPDSPSTWTSDKAASPATVGLHTPHANNPDNRPGIPAGTGYACDVCHSSDPGGDADHNTAKSNATMANMTGNGTATVNAFAYNAVGTSSVVDDTCASVTCHGERTWTRAWAKPADCNDCHGDKSGAQITTGSHEKHTSPTFRDYACTVCHIDNLNNYSTHYDGDVDMSMAAGTYARGTDFETYTSGNEYSTCSVTCHGSAIVDLSMQPSTPPKWADSLTAECGDCHVATGATITIAGSHKNHANLRALPCGTCHSPDTDATHVDGFVNFTSGNLLAATGVCDQCHGASSPDAKADWPTATTQTCDECHIGTGDVKNYVYGDATMTVIDDTQWTTTGHGRTNATTYALSTNNGANKGCGDCHDYLVLHDDGANPFRLLDSDTDALCLGCHDGTGPGESALDPASHHISVTNLAGRADWPFGPKCVDCHDPHGDDNLSMIRSQVNTPKAPNYDVGGGSNAFGTPTSGGLMTAVSFLNRDGMAADSYATGTGTGICEICHSNAVAIPVDWYNRQGEGNATDHAANGGAPCTNCHKHFVGFQGGGESSGGQACGGCHASLFDNMTTQSSYHHYMENADATYGSDNLDPLETPDVATRNCLMCHVDHDIFSPDLNSGFGTRAANLRQDATTTAIGQGDANDLINTDFWPANPKYTGETAPVAGNGANNGVCISCHDSITNPFLTKNTTKRGAGDGSLKARGINTFTYFSSSHNFQIISSQNNYGDGSSFRANCSKCHGSTAFNKPTAQTGEKFGLHDSSYSAALRPNGEMSSPPAALKDDLCYSCHSQDARAVGGPGTIYDYYSSVAMAPGSKLIKAASTAKTYGHPTQATTSHKPDEYYDAQATGAGTWNSGATRHVECVDCHNTHGGNSNVVRVVAGPGCCSDSGGTPVTEYGNAVAGAQKGVWGVSLDYTAKAAGEIPAFTKVAEVSTQYGVCMKCHSAYSYNASPPSIPGGGPDPVGVSGGVAYDTIIAGISETDQSKEFNPANAGYHPVLAQGRNQPPKNIAGNGWPNSGSAMAAPKKYYNVYTQMTGFYNYSGLGYTFVPPWSNTSLMSCTDCHAADNTGKAVSSFGAYSTVTQGSWDTDAAGGTLSINDSTFATSNGTTQMKVNLAGASFPGTATKIELAMYINHTLGKNKSFPYQLFNVDASLGTGNLTSSSTGGSFVRVAVDVTALMATCNTAACLSTAKVALGAPGADAYLTKVALEAYYPFTEKLRGPHGSLGRWILETANTDVKFQDPATGTWITPNAGIVAGSTEEKVFCYNCHRRDVYGAEGGAKTYGAYSRADHGFGSAGQHTDLQNPFGIWCMNCHGGRGSGGSDLNGGIHGIYEGDTIWRNDFGDAGTNFAQTMPRPLGVRLLYGGTGVFSSDATGSVYCYTNTGATATGSCTSEAVGDWAVDDYVGNAGRITSVQYTYTAW